MSFTKVNRGGRAIRAVQSASFARLRRAVRGPTGRTAQRSGPPAQLARMKVQFRDGARLGAPATGRSDARARERRPPVGTARRRRAAGKDPEFGVVRLSARTSAFSVIRAAAWYTPFAALRTAVPTGGRRSLACVLLCPVGYVWRGAPRRHGAMRRALAGGQRVPAPTGRTGRRSAFPGLHAALLGGVGAERGAAPPRGDAPCAGRRPARADRRSAFPGLHAALLGGVGAERSATPPLGDAPCAGRRPARADRRSAFPGLRAALPGGVCAERSAAPPLGDAWFRWPRQRCRPPPGELARGRRSLACVLLCPVGYVRRGAPRRHWGLRGFAALRAAGAGGTPVVPRPPVGLAAAVEVGRRL